MDQGVSSEMLQLSLSCDGIPRDDPGGGEAAAPCPCPCSHCSPFQGASAPPAHSAPDCGLFLEDSESKLRSPGKSQAVIKSLVTQLD